MQKISFYRNNSLVALYYFIRGWPSQADSKLLEGGTQTLYFSVLPQPRHRIPLTWGHRTYEAQGRVGILYMYVVHRADLNLRLLGV